MSNDKIISIKKDSIIMDSIIMDLLIMESNSYGNVQIVRMIPIIVLVFTLCLDGFDWSTLNRPILNSKTCQITVSIKVYIDILISLKIQIRAKKLSNHSIYWN